MSLYGTILRKTVLPFVLTREGQASSLLHFRSLLETQYWSSDKLRHHQWQQVARLLRQAYDTVPYYRRIFDSLGASPQDIISAGDLTALPILTRDVTFEERDNLFSSAYVRDTLQEFASGGTTGQQAKLYRDQVSFNIKQGLTWRHESWMGRYPCDKMALVWPAAMDIEHRAGWKSRLKTRYFLRQQMYNAGTLSEEALSAIHADMRRFGPTYIKAFASALEGFTRYCLDTNKRLPRVKGVMSTGEPLYDHQRRLFVDAFKVPVFDMYGSRETGNTGCECEAHDGRHIAMETQYVEFVDQVGRPVPYGQEGEMLITDLTNHAFPLIRYRINDYGIPLDRQCTCGRGLMMMDKVVGRLSDDIWGPDGTRHLGHVFGIAITAEGPPIGQTQVIQRGLTDFLVRITDKPQPTPDVFDYIRAQMRRILKADVAVTIEVVPRLPQEKSGKTRFVKCEIQPPVSSSSRSDGR